MTNGRDQMAERLKAAREHGDIRENAEYDAAKNEQGLMESQIRRLQETLRDPEIVEAPVAADAIVPHMLVTVRSVDDGEDEETYLLAEHGEEKAPGARTVTTSSPLGSALMGAAKDQEVAGPGARRQLPVRGRRLRAVRRVMSVSDGPARGHGASLETARRARGAEGPRHAGAARKKVAGRRRDPVDLPMAVPGDPRVPHLDAGAPMAADRAALALNVLTGLLILAGDWFAAGWALLVAGLCDVFDGSVARHYGQQKRSGAFMDSVLDRVADMVLFACLFWALAEDGRRSTPRSRS